MEKNYTKSVNNLLHTQQRALSQASNQFAVDYSNADLAEALIFHGYNVESMSAQVTVLLHDNNKIDELAAGQREVVVLANTPFYAESGGQIGDTGQLTTEAGAVFRVDDTQKLGNAIARR